MTRCAASLALLLLPLLTACPASAPVCVGMSPIHPTIDGAAQVDGIVTGQTVEDVLHLQTSASADVVEAMFWVEFQVTEEDDTACPMEVTCQPDEIDVGDDITCDLTSEADEAGCRYEAEVIVTVTRFDGDICTDNIQVHNIEARQLQ
jgi:hypothetical protein